MKVAFLSKWQAIHTVRWVNELAARGYEIHLITMHPNGEPLHPDIRVHLLPFPAPFGYYLNLMSLKKLLANLQPDMLNVHYASGYGTLGRLCGYHPMVLSVWGSDVYDYPYESKGNMRRVVKNLQAADRVCSTSHAMADQTRKLCPDLGDIAITPFGIDTDLFRPMKNAPLSACGKRLGEGAACGEALAEGSGSGKGAETIVVGTVKVLAPKYGIDTLLRAYKEVTTEMARRGSKQKVKLMIVGGGPQQAELEKLALDLGIAGATEFTGRVPHARVPEYLNRLDIYVAASRLDSESFGVAILEASACEVPVVVSNVGGLPEVVEEGVTGLIVPKEDPTALSHAILSLMEDSARREQMGRAGRVSVIASYRWSDNATIMEDVYAQATGQDRSARQPPAQTP